MAPLASPFCLALSSILLLCTQPALAAAPATAPQPASSPPTAAYVLGGIALGSLAAGTSFGLLALEQKGIRDDHCSSTQRLCDPRGAQANERGRRYLRYGIAGLALGGVSLLGSVALFQMSSENSRLQSRLSPQALTLEWSRRF